jgi:hypothetical protein
MTNKKLKKRKRPVYKKWTKAKIIKAVKKVCELYTKGEYTIESCCNSVGVPYRTFMSWFEKYNSYIGEVPDNYNYFAELADLYRDAKESSSDVFRGNLIKKAENALEQKLVGYEYEETVTEVKQVTDNDGNTVLVPVGIKKTKKRVLPSDAAIKFTLTALKPEVYGDRSTITNLNIETDKYKGMSMEEIEEEIKKVRSDLDKK